MWKHLKRKLTLLQYQALRRVQFNIYHCVFLLFRSFPDHLGSSGNSVDTFFACSDSSPRSPLNGKGPIRALGCSHHTAALPLSQLLAKAAAVLCGFHFHRFQNNGTSTEGPLTAQTPHKHKLPALCCFQTRSAHLLETMPMHLLAHTGSALQCSE